MEVRSYVLMVIVGAAAVTFIPRVLPLMVLSRFRIPDWGMRWLHYVPVSIMAALVAQELLVKDGSLIPLSRNTGLWAALPAFWVAAKTRSLLGAVITGIVCAMVLRMLL